MVKDVAAKWSTWTALERLAAIAKATLYVLGVALTALVVLSGYASLPGSVEAHETRLRALEAADAEQTRQIAELYRQTGYLVCDGLARSGAGARTQAECAADYITGRTQ